MAYVINKTNGQQLMILADGTLDTSTSLFLIGKNYPGYGELQQENFIRLLETGANNTAIGKSSLHLRMCLQEQQVLPFGKAMSDFSLSAIL